MIPVSNVFELAVQHHQAGRLAEAEALYRQVLAVRPHHVDALHFLGLLSHQIGSHGRAVDLIRQAVSLDPNQPDALCNLGEAHRALGRLDEATAMYRRAIELQRNHAEAWDNLGIALAEQGHFEQAIAAHQQALQLKPDHAPAHNNLGTALVEIGRLDDAMAAFRAALRLKPDYPDAQFNYSLLLLLEGDFERGWPLYEARSDDLRSPQRDFLRPKWEGGPVDGRRVLIHAEQGFGDSIQFIRYARLLASRGAGVIVECPSSLATLLRGAPGVSEVIVTGDPLPIFDLHVPMLSLPMLFQTMPETIPREIPYLFPEKNRSESWAERLGGKSSRLRVGLAWAGRPQNARLRKRHLSLDRLLPLLEVKGVDFLSLQADDGSTAIRQWPGASRIIDFTGHLRDFADTAAFMAHLDLIISIDTAVAHLGGALGRPVWTLLPFVPDWRWGLKSEISPWYPTMRLFRQPSIGDWDSVIQRAASELSNRAAIAVR